MERDRVFGQDDAQSNPQRIQVAGASLSTFGPMRSAFLAATSVK